MPIFIFKRAIDSMEKKQARCCLLVPPPASSRGSTQTDLEFHCEQGDYLSFGLDDNLGIFETSRSLLEFLGV